MKNRRADEVKGQKRRGQSQGRVRCGMPGGGQNKQPQALLHAHRCRLYEVRRGEASTEAEWSCDSTPTQLRRTVYVLPAAVLHTGHRGLFFFSPTAIIKIGNREETETPVGFLYFCPTETEHAAFYTDTSQP